MCANRFAKREAVVSRNAERLGVSVPNSSFGEKIQMRRVIALTPAAAASVASQRHDDDDDDDHEEQVTRQDVGAAAEKEEEQEDSYK